MRSRHSAVPRIDAESSFARSEIDGNSQRPTQRVLEQRNCTASACARSLPSNSERFSFGSPCVTSSIANHGAAHGKETVMHAASPTSSTYKARRNGNDANGNGGLEMLMTIRIDCELTRQVRPTRLLCVEFCPLQMPALSLVQSLGGGPNDVNFTTYESRANR